MERFKNLDKYRVKSGLFTSPDGAPYGFFFIRKDPRTVALGVMAAPFDGTQEWEHVSVSHPTRCPTWDEMAWIKSLFWDEEDCVIQFHPPKSQYVNNHPFCLHLWRNVKNPTQTPPTHLIGVKK